jgi:hypothetical protein
VAACTVRQIQSLMIAPGFQSGLHSMKYGAANVHTNDNSSFFSELSCLVNEGGYNTNLQYSLFRRSEEDSSEALVLC